MNLRKLTLVTVAVMGLSLQADVFTDDPSPGRGRPGDGRGDGDHRGPGDGRDRDRRPPGDGRDDGRDRDRRPPGDGRDRDRRPPGDGRDRDRRPPGDIFDPGDPRGRYIFIGRFDTSNPFKTDTDTIESNYAGRTDGIILQLDSGADVDVSSITVYCGRGEVCGTKRDVHVGDRRSTRLSFRRPVRVNSITVKSRPQGFPPSRVNVYLERAF